jgi:predicted small lipoprotein YifL
MPRSVRFGMMVLLLAIVACGLIGPLAAKPAAAEGAAKLGANLVVNPGADAALGSPDDSHKMTPPGWSTTGCLTAVQYGASGGFPSAASPGPKNRGKNMFQGGPGCPLSTATQVIDVSALAPVIDAGHAAYDLSGYLGGFSGQADSTTISADFENANGHSLGKTVIGPVTPAGRQNTTGLVARSRNGAVPIGTRSVRVTITATRTDGSYNDGSADSLAFVITKM